jgi:hypothetical protein
LKLIRIIRINSLKLFCNLEPGQGKKLRGLYHQGHAHQRNTQALFQVVKDIFRLLRTKRFDQLTSAVGRSIVRSSVPAVIGLGVNTFKGLVTVGTVLVVDVVVDDFAVGRGSDDHGVHWYVFFGYDASAFVGLDFNSWEWARMKCLVQTWLAV